jgi:DNA-binding transcriptional LysR family regulator
MTCYIERMDLRRIDLNLLVYLDVMLEERKLVSAARRLGISQPSASAALQRCRKLFGDPLLVRSGRGLEPTARAEALRGPIRAFVDRAQELLGAPAQDIATTQRTVRIVSSDAPALDLLKMLWERLAATAPGINLVLLHWRESDHVIDALARNRADLAITLLLQARSGYQRTELCHVDYCVAMRRDHPLASEFDLDGWLSYPHVIVSATGARHTALDDQLAVRGRERRVAVTVPSFLMVPPLLAQSDLVAMLPRCCMRPDPALCYHDPPMPVEGFPLHLAVASRSQGDLAVQHVATLIRDYFATEAWN